ncbi:glutathione peroxidase [Arcanobacterium haemolyticum]|nr:glutathione peroxidase [Arcanobacterium haemolyticum]
MDLRTLPFLNAAGEETSLAAFGDRLLLVVNVASKCGLTPQYEQLEELQRTYGPRGLMVVGFPCNQFLGQEPGSMEQILDYCSSTWGVSFPIMGKIKVNGMNAAPLYRALKKAADGPALGGPIKWNFEKFVVAPSGAVFRFAPTTKPDDPEVIAVIEENLPEGWDEQAEAERATDPNASNGGDMSLLDDEENNA